MTLGPPTRDGCDALLALWERGLGQDGWLQADALLREEDESAAARTLGARTRALVRLHSTLFGPRVELVSQCPSCDSLAQFSVDCDALLEGLPVPTGGPVHRLELPGCAIEFRLPTSADIAAASNQPTDDAFARRLIARCVLGCNRDGDPVQPNALPDEILDAVSQQMEALDPGATVSFAVDCPDCATRWTAPLDVGQLVWQHVQTAAERLFLDVDALARAYGWTEREILSLPPARRAAYLQIVTA
jgi:hypothetical protein